ncbi:hypothetical protein CSA56_07620 [candidate division KSB3 bacterium]|uniref:Methyltransferase n=1 Tax=candidate division KSB3 bacterium TaxID=2044937 RepID=A0A2G6KGG2_9BACT|nr:MAG: hypothetical protein CSA56_07620 [candidate division KSB3 bacterium]
MDDLIQSDYDIVIPGSICPVFGNVDTTFSNVIPCVKPGGFIILDDGYLPDDSELQNDVYLNRSAQANRLAPGRDHRRIPI